MPIRPTPAAAALALLASLSLPALAADDSSSALRSPGPLTVDMSAVLRAEAAQPSAPAPAQPAAQPPGQAPPAAPAPRIPFGRAGSEFWTFGLGYSDDFLDDHAGELHAAYSRFLGDELEFVIELSAWYFDQRGDNTVGFNPTINLRWHFLHDENFTWSVYGDTGIGLLFAFDNVPDEGTGFNFTPRLGGGFTTRLSEDIRLQVGARWAHISNGRIEGDERNPGRDSLMIYAGIIIPF